MVINFEPHEFPETCEAGDRVFLTVFVGGRKGSEQDNCSSTCALHLKGSDGCGIAHMVRDGRDPEMAMVSAYTRVARPEPGTCNYEFEYEGEIDRCGSLPEDTAS